MVASTALAAACTASTDTATDETSPQTTSTTSATTAPFESPDDSTGEVDGTDETGETVETGSADDVPTPTTEPFVPATGDGRPFLELTLEEKIKEFLDLPNTTFAANIAAEMELTGDQRWVPWVMDLMRLGGSRDVSRQAAGALEALTGVESSGEYSADYVRFGSWARTNAIDPGEGYHEWKQVFYATIDYQYEHLLAQVSDRVTLGAIQWGGVRRGGIPELNQPDRLTIAQADFMTPTELVLGVVIGGESVAYPVRFLARHELANDTVGGVPVALGYCTLCLTALMFDRRLDDGQVLTFETSGLLMDSNKVMIDNETESLWNHLSGTSFAGPLAGTRLNQYPVATVRWEDWVADHPDTVTLDTPGTTYFIETPERPPITYDYTPGAAYKAYYTSEELWFPTLETPDVFELKEEVVTVDRDGATLALSLPDLETEDPFVYVLGEEPLVIVPNQGGARVYSAADVEGVPFEAWRHGARVEVAPQGVLHDRLLVNGLDGRNRIDVELPRIVSSQSFWFAWYGLHPDTGIWPPSRS